VNWTSSRKRRRRRKMRKKAKRRVKLLWRMERSTTVSKSPSRLPRRES
jgi:hypothetical protein